MAALDEGAVIMPEVDATEDLVPFAKGHVMGALLGPEWTGNDDRSRPA